MKHLVQFGVWTTMHCYVTCLRSFISPPYYTPAAFLTPNPSVHMCVRIWECMYTCIYYLSLYTLWRGSQLVTYFGVSHQVLWTHVRVYELTPLIIALTDNHLFRFASSVVYSALRYGGTLHTRCVTGLLSLISACQDLPTSHSPTQFLPDLALRHVHIRE